MDVSRGGAVGHLTQPGAGHVHVSHGGTELCKIKIFHVVVAVVIAVVFVVVKEQNLTVRFMTLLRELNNISKSKSKNQTSGHRHHLHYLVESSKKRVEGNIYTVLCHLKQW